MISLQLQAERSKNDRFIWSVFHWNFAYVVNISTRKLLEMQLGSVGHVGKEMRVDSKDVILKSRLFHNNIDAWDIVFHLIHF